MFSNTELLFFINKYIYIYVLCFHVTLQGSSLRLVLMVLAAGTGGTLQYGYNLAIMNAPTTVCLCLFVFFHANSKYFTWY